LLFSAYLWNNTYCVWWTTRTYFWHCTLDRRCVCIQHTLPYRTSRDKYDYLDPSIDRANRRTGAWAEDEDIKLKNTVQMHGGKGWGTIAALVPGRTKHQCRKRWKNAVDGTTGRKGKWAEDEDVKLKDAVQTQGDKDWGAIAALVPGRTKDQCYQRWHEALYRSIDPASGRTGRWTRWTEDEDIKLKGAVQMHGDKNWAVIAALVPNRTKRQCNHRWHDFWDPNIDPATSRTGKWAEDEDIKLQDAVQMHGGKDWGAIAALVPGRTRSQ
jgi:hypothetical protein